MYSLPDFENFQTSYGRPTNSEPVVTDSFSFQYPPPSSSPFLTLGSGFSEKSGIRRAPSEQNYRQNFSTNRKSSFVVRDPNKYKFSCDTCNRSYLFQSELDRHIAQHVKCSYEGCFFQGQTKIVELHKKLQHYTGLAAMISKLNTPEEIKKWREERRKNFPTAANIKRRQEQEAEKRARGEVLDRTHFRKRRWQVRRYANKDKPSFVRRRRRRRRTFRNNIKNVSTQSSDCILQEPGMPVKQRTGINNILVKFPGTRFIEMNKETDEDSESIMELDQHQEDSQQENNGVTLKEHSSNNANKTSFIISDSEVEDTYLAPVAQLSNDAWNVPTISNNAANKKNNWRTSSICEMESSDEYRENSTVSGGNATSLSFFVADKEIEDSEDEPPTLKTSIKSGPSADLPIQAKVGGALGSLMAAYDSNSESESKDEPVTKPMEIQPNKKKDDSYTKPSVRIPHIRDNRYARPYVSQRRITLLEKLLANEIRHERNVIFQCVNYIVKNNFFDKSE